MSRSPNVHISGNALYAILDLILNGYITWFEQKKGHGEVRGVLMFTTGDRCEEYVHKVMPARAEHTSVCRIGRPQMQDFVKKMLRARVEYALVDVPPVSTDQLAEGEAAAESAGNLVRDYAIVDLKKLRARFTA